MRPFPGDEAFGGRSRRSSLTDTLLTPMPGPHQPSQSTTYFLADEETMDASVTQSSASHSRSREHKKVSNFGVESLETTISTLAAQDSDDQDEETRNARIKWKKGLQKNFSPNDETKTTGAQSPSPKSSADVSRDMSPFATRSQRWPKDTTSRPLTPLFLESPLLGSTLSSPSSRRNSETDFSIDDAASQAIISSGDDEPQFQVIEDNSSTSQLVMPSISLPTRRPFTEKGKTLGRLKVLVAGDSGVGKTSLIKAIVQTCGDIVHVDPLSTPILSLPNTSRRRSNGKPRGNNRDHTSTSKITEIYASTRAYPHWWSELDDSKLLRRRRSTGDSVLERNFCFVDTPGYGNGMSCMESITPVVEYLETQSKISSSLDNMGDTELITLLSGSGGSQVDVVFYVILHRIKPVDIEYLRRLSPLTNIIPLISQVDSLSSDQIQQLKENVLCEFRRANIRPFLFGASLDDIPASSSPSPPYAISTVASSDYENMDASLLMSPDYVQPLVQTELSLLVEQVFERDTISWLRHSTAKKLVQWRKGLMASSSSSQSVPQSLSLASYHPMPSSRPANASSAATSYTLARVTDHERREEFRAQIRLSEWAANLQRSMQNERARFEEQAKGERAIWLTERLGECVADGTIVAICDSKKRRNSHTSGALAKQAACLRRTSHGASLDDIDPLGLMQLKAKGWLALQVFSSVGIIGGMTYFFARNWHFDKEGQTWGHDWAGLLMPW